MKNMVICGVGTISSRVATGCTHARNMNLLGFQSRHLEKAQDAADRFGAPRAYGSFEDVLADGQVDAVYLCTPNGTHAALARQALLAGKAVISEKPLSPSPSDIRELFSLARERGLLLMEAQKACFSPLLLKVRDLVDAGAIGTPYLIDADYCYDIKGKGLDKGHWLFGPAGGCVLDVGVYPAALACLMARSSIRKADVVRRNLDLPCDADGQSLVSFDNGLVAHIACSWMRDVPSKGTATLYGSEGSVSIPAFWKTHEARILRDDGSSETVTADFADDFAPEIEAAASALESGLSECPQMDEEMSLSILRAWGIDG